MAYSFWSRKYGATAWRVVAREGDLTIEDESGGEPLRPADDRERIINLWLAASAPRLRAVLARLAKRYAAVLDGMGGDFTGYTKGLDSGLLRDAEMVLIDSHPTPEELKELHERDRQLSMQFPPRRKPPHRAPERLRKENEGTG